MYNACRSYRSVLSTEYASEWGWDKPVLCWEGRGWGSCWTQAWCIVPWDVTGLFWAPNMPTRRGQADQNSQGSDGWHVGCGAWHKACGRYRLSDVSMEHASETGRGEPALTIEKCQCPPSYQGASCQVWLQPASPGFVHAFFPFRWTSFAQGISKQSTYCSSSVLFPGIWSEWLGAVLLRLFWNDSEENSHIL